jgi:protein-tyrosine kinase
MIRERAVTNGWRFTNHAQMHALCRSIDYLLPATRAKTVQFIGVKGEEGVSTVVREFAATAAQVLQKRVLILDAAHHNPSQHVHFSVDSAYGWIDAFRKREPVMEACYRLDEHPSLFLSPISSQPSLLPWCADEAASTALFQELKASFDLVLIDSAPALVSADSLTTSRFCDGVILVIESEKSWRLAETAKGLIADHGGSILGMIFNKRTFLIPDCIYRRLY